MNDRLKKIIVVIIAVLLALFAVLFINRKKSQPENFDMIKENDTEIQEVNINIEEKEGVQDIQTKKVTEKENVKTSSNKKPIVKNSKKQITSNLNEVNITKDNVKDTSVENKDEAAIENSNIIEVTQEYKMKGGDRIHFQGVNYIIKHRNLENK